MKLAKHAQAYSRQTLVQIGPDLALETRGEGIAHSAVVLSQGAAL